MNNIKTENVYSLRKKCIIFLKQNKADFGDKRKHESLQVLKDAFP